MDRQPFFSPPLWRQRRTMASQYLYQTESKSVFDVGCGEGSLIQILLNDPAFERIAGLDQSKDALYLCETSCQPCDMDRMYLRELPVDLRLYRGTLAVADRRLFGFDAIVSLEVIEHLDPCDLEAFPSVVFGDYNPPVVILSTPNIEFNIHFPNLKTGTAEATLRDDDHRFEWTRREFQQWCVEQADAFGYTVTFDGVGTAPSTDLQDVGFCTQFAIFKRIKKRVAEPNGDAFKTPYEYVCKIDIPYFTDSWFTQEDIVSEAEKHAQYLVEETEPGTGAPAGSVVPIKAFWNILRLRQVSKRLSVFIDALKSEFAATKFLLSDDETEVTVLFAVVPFERLAIADESNIAVV